MNKLELALLVCAAMWMNFNWDYLTPRPKHAFHHRAPGRGHWRLAPGRHRVGGWASAAGRAR